MAMFRGKSSAYSEPDRGYAFVILFASFVAHVLQYGVVWTVGVFFAIFVEVFPDNSGVVALISSLNTAFYYGAGPLSGFLTNKYGPRRVAMVGGLVGSCGLILSMYANNVYTLYATFGVIAGFGLGLAYIPSVTILGLYFDKYRSVAIGVAVSGCGVGTFLFPPLIQFFITHFGWRGALLLVGAVTLNMCICGALLRPFREPPTDLKTQYEKMHQSIGNDNNDDDAMSNMSSKAPSISSNLRLHTSGGSGSILNILDSKNHLSTKINSRGDPEMNRPLVAKNKTVQALIASEKSYHSSLPCVLGSRSTLPGAVTTSRPAVNGKDISLRDQLIIKNKLHNSVIGNKTSNSCYTSMLTVLGSQAHLPPRIQTVEFKARKKNLINLFIFKNYKYVLLCINNFSLCFGLSIVYVHLAAYAASTGVDPERSALLFSVIGITNFIGRIAFGAIGHMDVIAHTGLYALALFLSGLVTFVGPFYNHYYWLMAMAAGFGFLTGSFGSLLPQVIIQILEVQYLTSGYGYLLIFEAMGTLLGAPVAGWLYVWSGVYQNSMYLGGGVIMIASFIMFYPWLCSNRCKKPVANPALINLQNTEDSCLRIEVTTVET